MADIGQTDHTEEFPDATSLEWPYGDAAANAEDDRLYSEPDLTTLYCGVALVGGWCKRLRGHYGGHACS